MIEEKMSNKEKRAMFLAREDAATKAKAELDEAEMAKQRKKAADQELRAKSAELKRGRLDTERDAHARGDNEEEERAKRELVMLKQEKQESNRLAAQMGELRRQTEAAQQNELARQQAQDEGLQSAEEALCDKTGAALSQAVSDGRLGEALGRATPVTSPSGSRGTTMMKGDERFGSKGDVRARARDALRTASKDGTLSDALGKRSGLRPSDGNEASTP